MLKEIKNIIRQELIPLRALKSKSTNTCIADLPISLKHCYFITTNKGIYRAEKNKLYHVTPWPLYGFAIHNQKAYCALTIKKCSLLLSCDLDSLLGLNNKPNWTEINRYESSDTNCRFHGMDIYGDTLWLAHTGEGGLLEYKLNDLDQKPRFHTLIRDYFGNPINYDLNHINGVTAYKNLTLFTTYRVGKRSGIGVLEGDKVTIYPVENTGIHDAYFHRDDLYHCDTFGSNQQGYVMKNNLPWNAAFFDVPPGYIIRGLSGDHDEMLVGHSHKGDRKNRFKGQGTIIFFNDGELSGQLDIPGSQVYQIIRKDGLALSPKPADISSSDAHKKLHHILGEPIYQGATIVDTTR